MKPVGTRVESARLQRWRLNLNVPVSEFAFKFRLRRYKWVDKMNAVITVEAFAWLVGRGLLSSTTPLNLSAFCWIGGAFKYCSRRVWEVTGVGKGCLGCILSQKRLKLS